MWNKQQLWIATTLLAFIYFAYSFSANGFYQQDEAAHFLSMRGFWFSPHSILSNWAKPGYKLIYALPALAGATFVTFFNCTVAALTAFMAYRIAEQLGSKIPALAFVALALQPLWFNLAFRNYSEIITALLLTLSVWMHLRQQWIFAALALSYAAFIRQELYPFVGLYFLWLGYRKQWIAALLLGTFPLLQNVWGWAVSGDPLYLINQILKSSGEIGGAYPRKGFNHYFLMSITIYGAPVVLAALVYLTMTIASVRGNMDNLFKKPDVVVWLVFVLYFLMYSVFNWQAVEIGPSGGGNLRYLLVISPLGAVMTAFAVEWWEEFQPKNLLLYAMGGLAVLVALFMSYEHNYVVFTEERDWRPFVLVMLGILILLFPLKKEQKWMAFSGLILLSALVTVRPIKLSGEDAACQRLAAWYSNYEQSNGEPPALYLHHDMFYYYLGRTRYEFNTRPQFITDENVKAAPKGSLIIWDSHYSYRPELRKESLTYDYFTSKPDQYEIVHEVISDDQTFGALVFRKR
ncbi:glycosyltransferase family 87 protein [Rhodoflexus sp.]